MARILFSAHRDHGSVEDFRHIRALLRRRHPGWTIGVGRKRLSWWQRQRFRGGHVISFPPYKGPLPAGATLLCGQQLTKAEECERLAQQGIPVPRWRLWAKGEPRPDLEALGHYVVRKPNRGARGADVKLVKTSRAKWKAIEVAYAGLRSDPFFQEFIYTGPFPVSFRVGSLFGSPIYSFKAEARTTAGPTPPVDATATGRRGQVPAIVANTQTSTYTDCFDPGILELARRAHGAFPEIPLLGIDIIRHHPSGQCYVVEVNASGYAWHFSSPIGREMQAAHGIDFAAQYGGLARAAEILAERFAT
jgi:hypothetical protein